MSALFAYAKNAKGELGLSVVLSVVSILLGLVPFFCMYRVICLFAAGTAAKAAVISWCAWSLAAYAGKVLCFTLSTGISHHAAYNILEGLRLRLVERFLHAPLGEVQKHSIGEIKSILVDKIENIEPPLAHMIPEGAGHIVLLVVSFIALFAIDWRLALAALAVMLSMSMVGSLAKLEVFSENMRQVKATVESLEAFLEMPALPEPAQPAALQGTGVELKNVHFSYSADGPEVLHRKAGGGHGAGGPLRRRQIHCGKANRPVLGCDARLHHHRRGRCAPDAACPAFRPCQLCHAG